MLPLLETLERLELVEGPIPARCDLALGAGVGRAPGTSGADRLVAHGGEDTDRGRARLVLQRQQPYRQSAQSGSS